MLFKSFATGKPTSSAIFEEAGISSFLTHLRGSLSGLPQDWAPRKSRQECLEGAKNCLRKGASKDWVRFALDLATHTLFHTERSSDSPQVVTGHVANLVEITDFEHWDQLCTSLSEVYGSDSAELKLLLITGAVGEVESIVSREVDGLTGPYRATQSIEAWIRHHIARKPRGFDIESVKNLAAQYNYNHNAETPIHELVELGLSNVINLHSIDGMVREYERIFVRRRSVATVAVQGIAIFAVSYKHEGPNLRMSQESFFEVCDVLKKQGFEKVQLWIDAVLKKSTDTWARRGLLPYTVLPIVIHNNEIYDKGEERIWLKLERVASSGRSGVLYTRPTKYDHASVSDCVNGDARDLVAACVLLQDYDPNSVTYESDVVDLMEWATEHFTVATFRSFLGISRRGQGRVAEDLKQECLYSAVLKYDDTMPHRDVQYVSKQYARFPDSTMNCGYREIRNRAFARNERIMSFVFRLDGSAYKARVSHGLGITVFRLGVVREPNGTIRTERVYKTKEAERRQILATLTDRLIRFAEEGEESLWSWMTGQRSRIPSRLSLPSFMERKALRFTLGESRKEEAEPRNPLVSFDKWIDWPMIFPASDGGIRT